MRSTDNRYANEQRQFQLAIRMIGHEARTRTIKECTGLSDDRIRKIFSTYFKPGSTVRRRRGKSPRQVSRFVKSAEHRLQSTTLVGLFCAGRLIRIDADNCVHACWPRLDIESGHRLCRAFETYKMLHDPHLFSFEWACNLLLSICYNDELYLAACKGCGGAYVEDAYALPSGQCPCCDVTSAR
ncbi:MAG: FlhC family transcriptional regulator [Woeseiaceae bacterium]|nr:FlhC family transcriptional regulator [Woeseiaceae bacterium]